MKTQELPAMKRSIQICSWYYKSYFYTGYAQEVLSDSAEGPALPPSCLRDILMISVQEEHRFESSLFTGFTFK